MRNLISVKQLRENELSDFIQIPISVATGELYEQILLADAGVSTVNGASGNLFIYGSGDIAILTQNSGIYIGYTGIGGGGFDISGLNSYLETGGFNLNDTVRTTGNQSITGEKAFNSPSTFNQGIGSDNVYGLSSDANVNLALGQLESGGISQLNWLTRELEGGNWSSLAPVSPEHIVNLAYLLAVSGALHGYTNISGLDLQRQITSLTGSLNATGISLYSRDNPSGYISTGDADARFVNITGEETVLGFKNFQSGNHVAVPSGGILTGVAYGVLNTGGYYDFSVSQYGDVTVRSWSSLEAVTNTLDEIYQTTSGSILDLSSDGNIICYNITGNGNVNFTSVSGAANGSAYYFINYSTGATVTFVNSPNIKVRGNVDMVLGYSGESCTIISISDSGVSIH